MKKYTQQIIALLDSEIQRLDNELGKITPLDLEQLLAVIISVVLMFTSIIYGGGVHLDDVYLTNNTTIYLPLNSIPLLKVELVGNNTITKSIYNITSCIFNVSWNNDKYGQHYLKLQLSYPSQIQYFIIDFNSLYLLFILAVFELVGLGIGLLLIGRSMVFNKKFPVGIANTIRFLSMLVAAVSATYLIVYLAYSTGNITENLKWMEKVEEVVIIATLSVIAVGILGVVWLSYILEKFEGTKELSKNSKMSGVILSLAGILVLVFAGYKIVWSIPPRLYLKLLYFIIVSMFSILTVSILLKYYNRVKIASMIRNLQGELIQIKQHLLIEPTNLSLTRKPVTYSEKILKTLEIIQFGIEDSQKDRDILEKAVFWLN